MSPKWVLQLWAAASQERNAVWRRCLVSLGTEEPSLCEEASPKRATRIGNRQPIALYNRAEWKNIKQNAKCELDYSSCANLSKRVWQKAEAVLEPWNTQVIVLQFGTRSTFFWFQNNFLPPFYIDILNPECVRIPWVLAPKNFHVQNFRVRSVLQKSSIFHWFLLPPPKKKYRARVPTILMPQTFPIASLNRYTPNFSGVPQKLT